MTSDFLSIIPARAGSKGLKNKNVFPLCGRPLITWTIEASNSSKYIEYTFVSSDSEIILKIAEENDAKCLLREKELASDNASMVSVLQNAIHQVSSLGIKFKNLILLQPTSPLRSSEDIDMACKKFLSEECSSLISVNQIENTILKSLILDKDNFLKPAFDETYPSANRQTLPQTYQPNGAIYILNKEAFMENPTFLQERTTFYLMDKKKSIDVDSIVDIREIEKFLQTQRQK
ncbi:acylneuraminate cytidylyltransferase family protein [Gammaproteobacteria bacterium]|nr:acylneuraminate cytidylyltransferase family protein [Gammaproteobacteria bacterium]